MRKQLLLAICLLMANLCWGQTSIYSQNFGTTNITGASSIATALSGGGVTWSVTDPTGNWQVSNTTPSTGGYSTPITASGNECLYSPSNASSGTATIIISGISTVGYGGVSIAMGARFAGTAATMAIAYSTDGTNYNTITSSAFTANATTWAAYSFTSGNTNMDNQSNLYVKLTFVRTGPSNGYRIDDFTILGTPFANYYSASTGNLDNLGTWSTNTNGVGGSSPSNFTSANVTYHIANSNAGVLGADWTVSGTGSRVVVENASFDISGFNVTSKMVVNAGNAITVASGSTLTTNDSLVLLSNASSTARIGTVAGTISGNVYIQRYVPGQRGYALMGHPYTSNIDLSQLSSYIDITGITGGSSCQGTSPSVFSYTPGAGAYTGITSGSGAFPAAAAGAGHSNGALVFLRGAKGEGCSSRNSYTPSAVTITTTGAVNQGTITQTVPAGGWNLISNPYPSQIVLSGISVSGGTIDAYKVVAPGGQFLNVYTNGTAYADAPTTTVIPINGAFLAHNSGVSDATLTFTEAGTKTSAAAVTNTFKTTSLYPTLELGVNYGSTMWDNWKLELKPMTGNAAGDNGDLNKISNAQLDIYSLSSDAEHMDHDARDADSIADGAIIALGIRSVPQATYTLTVNENNLPANKMVYLHDRYLNTYTQLTNGTSYSFTVDANAASQGEQRMELLFNNSGSNTGVNNVANTQGQVQIVPNPASSNVTFSYPAVLAGDKKISIINALGQTVKVLSSSERIVNVDISGLASGVYLVNTIGNNNVATGRFVKY